jgi:hypothetical protein
MTAAEHYAARVGAVLAQRSRLRGAEPSGDLFGGLEPDHPLLKADPRRPLDANLKALADLIEPSDAIVDVGGGAGRMSLPLALRCRSVTNVDPSANMGAPSSPMPRRPAFPMSTSFRVTGSRRTRRKAPSRSLITPPISRAT